MLCTIQELQLCFYIVYNYLLGLLKIIYLEYILYNGSI